MEAKFALGPQGEDWDDVRARIMDELYPKKKEEESKEPEAPKAVAPTQSHTDRGISSGDMMTMMMMNMMHQQQMMMMRFQAPASIPYAPTHATPPSTTACRYTPTAALPSTTITLPSLNNNVPTWRNNVNHIILVKENQMVHNKYVCVCK